MITKTILAAIVAISLSGCVTTNGEIAAIVEGQADAGVNLPPWPQECRMKEIHAALTKGEDIRVILKRERAALDRLNERMQICADYYDKLRELFAKSPERAKDVVAAAEDRK